MSDLDTLLGHLVTAGVKRAYKLGEVPASPVAPYCVLSLDSGAPQSKRISGGSTVLNHNLSAQLFGQSNDAVTDMARLADVAFKDTHLPLTDAPFSERVISTPPVRDPDATPLLYVLHTYQYQESK